MTRLTTSAPEWFKGTVWVVVNDTDRAAVRAAQRVLRIEETGEYTQETRALIQGFQALFKLPITGMIDRDTAIKLEQVRQHYA